LGKPLKKTAISSEMGPTSALAANRGIAVAWSLLAALALSLLSLAIYLLFRMDLFSGEAPTDSDFKALWTFLGVALGAVATIIGALLTEQNSRRADVRAAEVSRRDDLALKQQEAQSREAETRLTLETRARVLELITHENDYAPQARVAAAIATMIELGGGPVAMRILGDLWASKNIGSSAAVWMVNQILTDAEASDGDKAAAAFILNSNASQLVPAVDDIDQDWNSFPAIVKESWPSDLPLNAKLALQMMAVKALLAREPQYWREIGILLPVDILHSALDDDAGYEIAALTLAALLEEGFVFFAEETDVRRIQVMAEGADVHDWVTKLIKQVRAWAKEEAVERSTIESSTSGITSDMVTGDSGIPHSAVPRE
jgi:hypothetical protein